MKPINRLEILKEDKNLRNSDLDKILKLSNGATAKAIKSEASLKDESIIKLLEFFPELNIEWFLLGTGSMYKIDSKINAVKEKAATYLVGEEALKDQIKELKKDKAFLQDQLSICMGNLNAGKKNNNESA